MSIFFFPSCKVKKSYPESSIALQKYLHEKLGVEPIGCCRVHHKTLQTGDTAIVVCNNCAAILEESSATKDIDFVWSIIDQDPNFPFPDYHGEEITIQDCWIAVEKRTLQDTIRSLLKKMNFKIVELEENYEHTKFCGVNLLSPCNPSNAKLAPKRYVKDGAHMFNPCSQDEQIRIFTEHCRQISTRKVACYCKFCTEAISMGGKEGRHIVTLLFP